MLRKQGHFEQAARQLEIAVRLLPDDSSTRYLLAQTFEKLGRSFEAEAQLQAVQKENQRRRDASLATSDIILGTELLKRGEFASAEAKLREAVILSPNDPLTHYNYGLALLLREKLDDAIEQFRSTLRLQPDDPDTLYYLGRALLKKHAPAEAALALQQAIRANQDDAHAQNALAAALAGIGNWTAARARLQRARAIEPGNTLYEQNLLCLEQEMRNCELGY